MLFSAGSEYAAGSLGTEVWEFRSPCEAASLRLGEALGLTPLAARLLAARDILDPDAAQAFLNPALASLHHPFAMRDMERAAERIACALAEGERIAIYGDYDADGLTACALLVRFFDWLGAKVVPYIPHRLNEGYGMSRRGVDVLATQGVNLIVTVDNGINCIDEVAHGAARGIDVIVTDHHQPGEALPAAVAVVNPNREDCAYPFKGLSGVGIAFKLAHALARRLNRPPDEARAVLRSLMDLVAVGTVADIVPLVGENRALVAHGLKTLANTDKAGLRALVERLGVGGRTITGDTVAFLIGPRLNAAGRTEDARHALDLLLSNDARESQRLAEYLDQLNYQRRRLESEAFEEALRIIESRAAWLADPVLVVAAPGWHLGVLGIVAARLMERFNRPAIVLTIEEDRVKGCARSTPRFNIHQGLQACETLLTNYGGHKLAAGLTLQKQNVERLRESLNAVAANAMSEADLRPRLAVDATARIEELTLEALGQIDRMRPFGEGNPPPVVALMGCRLAEPPQLKKDKHLKLRLLQTPHARETERGEALRAVPTIYAMAFGAGTRYDQVLRESETFDVAATPTVNEWNGNRTVELTVKGVRPASL